MINNIEDFFLFGMKRKVKLISCNNKVVLNLGSGNSPIEEAFNLDLPEWDANTMPIPFKNDSVSIVHAHHFLEHINSVPNVLAEIQRVLIPNGVVYITVPFWRSKLAFQDLNHKNFFSLDTWKELFKNPFYKTTEFVEWKLKVVFNMICGIKEENLAILTQMVKRRYP